MAHACATSSKGCLWPRYAPVRDLQHQRVAVLKALSVTYWGGFHEPRPQTPCFACARCIAVIAAGASVVLPSIPASADPIDPACAGTTAGTTFTLTANCDTTVPLEVPAGFTVDGAGFTITARDPSPRRPLSGLSSRMP